MDRIVLCIHGIRVSRAEIGWQRDIDAALRLEGLAPTEQRGWRFLAPDYLDLLDADPVPAAPAPQLTHVHSDDAGRVRAAGAYWLAASRLERALGDAAAAKPNLIQDRPTDQLAGLVMENRPVFAQAKRYVLSPERRNAIQQRLLEALAAVADEAELIIVGYSLGSVVAADLLYHLPRSYRLALLATMASPLHLREVAAHLRRSRRGFPFERGAPWLNLVGQWDPIAVGRRVGAVFPEVSDVYVDTGRRGAHESARYLTQPALARAVAWADDSLDPVHDGYLPELSLDQNLLAVVMLSQYALRLAQAQKRGLKQTRFEEARLLVMDDVSRQLREHGVTHPIIARLGEDHAAVLAGRLRDDLPGLIDTLLRVHTSNPVAPYEIVPSVEHRRQALRAFSADVGVPTRWADVVAEAVEAARESHAGVPWGKAVVGAVGLAMVAVAPYLVLAAAPAQLAGGAAIIGGLAALGGGGGLMGGLAIVGAVGGAGGLAAARALTSGSASLVGERVVLLQARAEVGARLEQRDPTLSEWFTLAAMQSLLSQQLARHRLLNDRRSATTQELESKLKAVENAIRWLAARGLGPRELESADADAEGVVDVEV